jgi:drug/metabolite transporter (DMT)-like permease
VAQVSIENGRAGQPLEDGANAKTTVASHGPTLRPSRKKVVLAFAAIYTIWGSTYLGIRYGVETIPPFFLAGARYILAGSILYAWMRVRGNVRPTLAQWRAAGLIGGLLFLGGNGALSWAETRVPSGVASLVVSTIPIWMVLITHAQHKAKHENARLDKRVIAGLVVGVVGIVLLIGPSQVLGHGGVDGFGAVVLLCGSLSWAIGSLYSPKVGLPKSTMTAAAMEMMCGGVLLVLFGLLTPERSVFSIDAISARSALSFVYLTCVGSLVGFTSYNWLLTHSTPARVSTYAYVNPVVAVFLGWAIAGEAVTTRTLTAAALVVAAVALIITHREHVPTPHAGPTPLLAIEEEETPPLLPLD